VLRAHKLDIKAVVNKNIPCLLLRVRIRVPNPPSPESVELKGEKLGSFWPLETCPEAGGRGGRIASLPEGWKEDPVVVTEALH